MPWWTRAQVSEIQFGRVRCRHNALASLSLCQVGVSLHPIYARRASTAAAADPTPLLAYSAAVQDTYGYRCRDSCAGFAAFGFGFGFQLGSLSQVCVEARAGGACESQEEEPGRGGVGWGIGSRFRPRPGLWTWNASSLLALPASIVWTRTWHLASSTEQLGWKPRTCYSYRDRARASRPAATASACGTDSRARRREALWFSTPVSVPEAQSKGRRRVT